MSGHTPGPWTISVGEANCDEELAYGCIDGYVQGPRKERDEFHLATIWADTEGLRQQAPGNARLIAAAPDLLEALKRLVYWVTEDGMTANAYTTAAYFAIAKAESPD